MKLEYFPIHGRAIQIRLLLAYCKVDYEDIFVTFPEFAQRKKQGDFAPSGQLPMLTLNDGTKLFQTKSILRYIAKTQKGKNGENLYPGHSDPLLSFKIDEVIDTREDFLNNNLQLRFTKPDDPAWNQFFTDFILTKLPQFCEYLDAVLAKSGKRYLFGSQLTLADISVASWFYLAVYNDEHEMCHILQSIVERYPRVAGYTATMLKDFKFWRSTFKFPVESTNSKPRLGYWKIRGLAAAMRYQLVYCGVKFDEDQYEEGDAPDFSRDQWLSKKFKLGL